MYSIMNKRQKSLEVLRLPVGQMAANCYIVFDSESGQAIIIDPGDDGQHIMGTIVKHAVTPTSIVATHGHFDHIMAACELQISYNLPFLIHKKDEFLVKRMRETAEHFLGIKIVDPAPIISGGLSEGQALAVGSHKLFIIDTPGHTPGSVSFYSRDGRFVIVGDVLFEGGGVGRTDQSYANPKELRGSLQKILKLPPGTTIYSGHGQESTL